MTYTKRHLPVLSTCCGSKGNAQKYGIIVEIEEPFNSRLWDCHLRRSTYDLPPHGCCVPAFCTDADPQQQADQTVEQTHCTGKVYRWKNNGRRRRRSIAEVPTIIYVLHVAHTCRGSLPIKRCESIGDLLDQKGPYGHDVVLAIRTLKNFSAGGSAATFRQMRVGTGSLMLLAGSHGPGRR